jgi:hypothetical protein
MTKQENATSSEAVIDEALGVIDGALAKMIDRELVSSGEVADLLLDVRSLLTTERASVQVDTVDGLAEVVDPALSGSGEPISDPA